MSFPCVSYRVCYLVVLCILFLVSFTRMYFSSCPSRSLLVGNIHQLTLTNHTSIATETIKQTHSIQVYAQDPVFNELDTSLLASLDITVLETPLAFEKISSRTFLFCPGAERAHLEQVLPLNPAFVFGGPLEDVESEVVSRFLATKGSVRLPQFEEQEHTFWNMRVYYPQDKRE